ncbi:7925_t:CDS:2 [Acaulospora colombiana]|uniref:7925_t:CDS:1 n=1 Tax=Acaulospora colombiana TaxID=27376 RepID=A0ACA9KNG7_9GLOM|nr:7925_t:CDS:2 [Acaulospora colombiana]
MPVKTSSLSIKALPLEAISEAVQILSPSSILPSTHLFSLQITVLNDPTIKRTYKINVKQSSLLMQKSGLFYNLSTQYNNLAASYSSLNHEESLKQKLLAEEAGGLPMLCIEAPVSPINGPLLVDAFLDWLCSTADMRDILTSSLASKIQSHQDFFSLLNFSTLLNLFEPYRTAVDEILVYYYFGLSVEERRIGILSNEQFIEGLVPGRFAKRLAEAVSEDAATEILASFFRDRKSSNEMKKGEWEESSLDDVSSPVSKILEWINATHDQSVPGTPLTASLDYAEPPTPMGSAYFCTNASQCISRTPKTYYHMLSRSLPHSSSMEFKQLSYSGPPPNTPRTPDLMESVMMKGITTPTSADSDKTMTLSITPLVPPNTPNTSTSIEETNTRLSPSSSYTNSPKTPSMPRSICASPSTPTIVKIMDPGDAIENEMQLEKGKHELNQNKQHHEKKVPIKNSSDGTEVPTKRLKKMYEKSRFTRIPPTYVVIIGLAIMIFWLKYQGWFEFRNLKGWFDCFTREDDQSKKLMDFEGTDIS